MVRRIRIALISRTHARLTVDPAKLDETASGSDTLVFGGICGLVVVRHGLAESLVAQD